MKAVSSPLYGVKEGRSQGSVSTDTACYVGCYCSHAVLTVKIGVYRCPFGFCFKRGGASA